MTRESDYVNCSPYMSESNYVTFRTPSIKVEEATGQDFVHHPNDEEANFGKKPETDTNVHASIRDVDLKKKQVRERKEKKQIMTSGDRIC